METSGAISIVPMDADDGAMLAGRLDALERKLDAMLAKGGDGPRPGS